MKTGNLFRKVADFCDKNQPKIESRVNGIINSSKRLTNKVLVKSLTATNKALLAVNSRIESHLQTDEQNPAVDLTEEQKQYEQVVHHTDEDEAKDIEQDHLPEDCK